MTLRGTLTLAARAFLACACLYFLPPADAGWGGGGCPSCGPVGPAAFPAPAFAAPAATLSGPRYEWRDYPDGDARYMMLWDRAANCHEGTWTFETHTYRELFNPGLTNGFGWPSTPPVPPPPDRAAAACACDRCRDGCKCATQDECRPALPGDSLLTGVVSAKIGGGENYAKNGVKVDGPAAFEAMRAGGGVPDDSAKPSLTVVGTPEECARVKSDLAAAGGLLDAVLWQDYRPDDAMVAGLGFDLTGHPSVKLETPSGAVLYGRCEYDRTPLVAAIRRADPAYDPARDPDGAAADPLGLLRRLPAWVYVAAAVAGLYWWSRRKQ